MASEKTIYERFTFVLGIFIGMVVAAALGLSLGLLDRSKGVPSEDEAALEALQARLQPVGRVAMLGDEELAAAAAAAAAPEAPARRSTPLSGAQVFNEACYLCHAPPGVPGAPLVGDASAWEPRIAKGLDVLREHALNGFQGEAGLMPPKGGRVDLSDAEVLSGIDYMLEQVAQ